MKRAAGAVGAPIKHRDGMVYTLDLDMLRERFPGWCIGGAIGYWYPVRGGRRQMDGTPSLLWVACTRELTALAEKLCLQDYLDRFGPDELTAVYRDMAVPVAVAG